LSNTCNVRFGVKVYQKGKGKPPQTGEEAPKKIFESKAKESRDYFPYIRGKNISYWHVNPDHTWLKYGIHLAEPREIELFEGPRIFVRRIVAEKLIVVPVKKTLIADQLIHTVKQSIKKINFSFLGFLEVVFSRTISENDLIELKKHFLK